MLYSRSLLITMSGSNIEQWLQTKQKALAGGQLIHAVDVRAPRRSHYDELTDTAETADTICFVMGFAVETKIATTA